MVHVSLGPVRPALPPEPAGLSTRVRVVVRCGPSTGPVEVHRGWLHTDLAPGRRLRLAGCQVGPDDLLVSLAPVPGRSGRERLTDRFSLPFHLTAWGVDAVTGLRVELFCLPTVQPGRLVLRGRAAVVVDAPAARLRRAVPFCRHLAVEVNPNLCWRARAAVEGVDLRVEPGGVVEGRLHVAVVCWGEPEEAFAGHGGDAAGGGPAALRRVDARIARLEVEVVREGLALVSGAVQLDVAWADRSGLGRWTCREVPFSALVPLGGLCPGDQLEPVAQVERLARAGAGADSRALVLIGIGVTALRPVHREIGGAWYRVAQVVGLAMATVQLDEPLFPRPQPPAASGRWHQVNLDTGMVGPWTALRARIRRAGGRAALEVRAEPYGGGSPAAVRLDLPGGGGRQVGLAAVGPRAEVRAAPLPEGGVEMPLPRTAGRGGWCPLPEPVRWVLDAVPCAEGLRCLVRGVDGLRTVVLTVPHTHEDAAAGDDSAPTAWTVAGTAVRGLGIERVWVEVAWG